MTEDIITMIERKSKKERTEKNEREGRKRRLFSVTVGCTYSNQERDREAESQLF